MTNATDRTCSVPTSAPAARIWCTASKCASRWRSRAGSGSSSTTAKKAARRAAAPHQGPPPEHVSPSDGDPDYLLSAAAVRERCAIVLEAAERGETRHFRVHPDRLGEAVARVVAVTRRRYPDLDVPFHS